MNKFIEKINVRAFSILIAGALNIFLFVVPAWPQANSATVAIEGNTSPSLQSATLVGHRDPYALMEIVVGLTMRDEKDLDDLIARQNDPSSTDFHNFITPADFARRFGPLQADVDLVRQQLASNGLTVLQVSPNNMLVQARGTVWQIEQAFNVNINIYNLRGEQHFSNGRDPSVPSSLQGIVASVTGLTSLDRFHGNLRANDQADATQVIYTPQQIATAYNFPNVIDKYHGETIYSGKGEKIAIATAYVYKTSDIDYFWKYLGITRTGSVSLVHVNGSTDVTDIEPTLDIEQAGSQAPGADILVYAAPTSTYANFLLVFSKIVNDNLAQEASVSWESCENAYGRANIKSLDAVFKQGVAQGIAFFAGSGDNGAYDCSATSTTLAVAYPASDPYVTAVGATSLHLQADGRYASETAGVNGGGGVSSVFARPSWQVGPGVPKNANRDLADVSFDGESNTGYYIYYQGGWYAEGGTSMGGPNWAALWALRGQAAAGKRTGMANTPLYKLGASSVYHDNLHDITTGSNGDGTGPGYKAGPNWDYPTGWGTPNGTPLVHWLAKNP